MGDKKGVLGDGSSPVGSRGRAPVGIGVKLPKAGDKY